jgi:hypothetical protein
MGPTYLTVVLHQNWGGMLPIPTFCEVVRLPCDQYFLSLVFVRVWRIFCHHLLPKD